MEWINQNLDIKNITLKANHNIVFFCLQFFRDIKNITLKANHNDL